MQDITTTINARFGALFVDS